MGPEAAMQIGRERWAALGKHVATTQRPAYRRVLPLEQVQAREGGEPLSAWTFQPRPRNRSARQLAMIPADHLFGMHRDDYALLRHLGGDLGHLVGSPPGMIMA